MAAGFDELVDHILDELALAGSRGFDFNHFEHVVRQFYQEDADAAGAEADTTQSEPTDARPSTLFSDLPPESAPVIDNALLNRTWQWLAERPDTHVEQNDTSDGTSNIPGTTIPARARLFATEDRIWQTIAGHGVDHQRLPYREFELLTVIASKRAEGITQPDLCAATSQDKRSVPKRTDKLAAGGYITKEPVVANKASTSLLRMKKFAKDSAGDLPYIFYNTWFDETIRLLREQENGILAYQDLRIGLGIEGKKWQTKILQRCIRRLAETGCVEKLTATEVSDEVIRGPAHQREIRCLRLVRQPTPFDRVYFKKGSSDGPDFDAEPDAWGSEDADNAMGDEHEALPQTETVQWNPRQPYTNLLFDLVQAAGPEGITTAELQTKAFGPLYKRPMEEMIAKISSAWNASQPAHLRHLCIIRDTSLRQRNCQYVYRTYDNFKLAVERGLTAWEAVEGRGKKKKKKKKTARGASEPELDEWGFPQLPFEDFFGDRGDATLAEIAASVDRSVKPAPRAISTPTPAKTLPAKQARHPASPSTPLPHLLKPTLSVGPNSKEIEDFTSWAERTAHRYAYSHYNETERTERQASLEAAIIDQKRPGVYINPPGSRALRFGDNPGRGRPRKMCVAVFKLPGLQTLPWFNVPPSPARPIAEPDASGEGHSAAANVPPRSTVDARSPPAPGHSNSSLGARPSGAADGVPRLETFSKKGKRASKFDIVDEVPRHHLATSGTGEDSSFSLFIRSVGRLHMPTNDAPVQTSSGPPMATFLEPTRIRRRSSDSLPTSSIAKSGAVPRTPSDPMPFSSSNPPSALAIIRPYAHTGPLGNAPTGSADLHGTVDLIDVLKAAAVMNSKPSDQSLRESDEAGIVPGEAMDVGTTNNSAFRPHVEPLLPSTGGLSTSESHIAKSHEAHAQLELVPPPLFARRNKTLARMTTHSREQLILDTMQSCGGVYAGDGEIWYPLATAWMKLYNQMMDRSTATHVTESLHGSGQLKKVRFSFLTAKEELTTRHLLLLPEIDLDHSKVHDVRQAVIASWPHPFLPANVEITPEMRQRAEQFSLVTGRHAQKVASPKTDPSTSVPYHYSRGEFPVAPGAMVKRTSAAKEVLRGLNAQKIKSIYNERSGLEVLDDGTIGRRYYPSQAAHSVLNPDFLSHYVGLYNRTTTLRSMTSGRQKRVHSDVTQVDSDAESADSEPEKKKSRRGPRTPKPSPHMISLLMAPGLVAFEMSGTIGTVSTLTTSYGRRRKRVPVIVQNHRIHAKRSTAVTRAPPYSRQEQGSTARLSSNISQATPEQRGPLVYTTEVQQSSMMPAHLQWLPAEMPNSFQHEAAGNTRSLKPREATSIGTLDRATQLFENGPSPEISNYIGRLDWNQQSNDRALFPRLSQLASNTYTPRQLAPKSQPPNYQSRKRTIDDANLSEGEAEGDAAQSRRKYRRKTKAESTVYPEVERLTTAVAVSRLLVGGVRSSTQWEIVVHCMSFRLDAQTLRGRWRHNTEVREKEADDMVELLQEPFLEAYGKGDLPEVNYQNPGLTDWPAILAWAEATVARVKMEESIAPDLPSTREGLQAQLQLLPSSKPGAAPKEQFFLMDVWPRKELAHNHIYGIPVHPTSDETASDKVLELVKTYCRAIVMTKTSNYNAAAAADMLRPFNGNILEQAYQALSKQQYLAQEKKDRLLPGRNFYLHNNVVKTLKRWPGDERGHLRMIASARRSIVQHVQQHGQYSLTMHTFDPDMVVLTCMVAQGHLKMKVVLPARNDDPQAPFPKLTAWGYGDGDYFMRDVEPAKFRFPIVYEPTDRLTTQHGLKFTPIPVVGRTLPGESLPRIPFWVDIHGNLVEDAWDMALRSVLHLLVFRPGSTAEALSIAQKRLLGAWEIEIMLEWMGQVGIAHRCGYREGDGEGPWKGAWRAGEWWYCTFAPDVATWDFTGGSVRW